ncbi:hypothetical protein RCL1_000910 [Eukaryota sp. TZLM3-RCL]
MTSIHPNLIDLQKTLLVHGLNSTRSRLSYFKSLGNSLPSCPQCHKDFYSPSNFGSIFADRVPLRFPNRVSISSDKSTSLIGSFSGVIHSSSLSSLAINPSSHLSSLSSRCTALQSLHDNLFASGDAEGNLIIGAVQSSTLSLIKTIYPCPFIPITSISKLPIKSGLITTSNDGYLRLIDIESSTVLLSRHVSPTPTQSSSIHVDGCLVAVGSHDKSISLWDLRTGSQCQNFDSNFHTDCVTSLDFCFDGISLASGGMDHVINLIDLRNLKISNSFLQHTKTISKLKFLHTPKPILMSSGFDGSIIIRDVLIGNILWNCSAHDGRICDFDVVDNDSGVFVITAGSEGLVKMWSNNEFNP